jgi:hypothetical protein
MMIKFNKHNVTNGTDKARVSYSLDNRIDGRRCVTLYAKDYSGALAKVLGDTYSNNTGTQTDYFEKGKAVLFENHPLYAVARARALANGCYAPPVCKSLDDLRAEYR